MDGVLVGLEIHQQLNTGSKLFCRCTGVQEPGHIESFVRRLRPVKSEMGGYDIAALFEGSQDRTIRYKADQNNSCLVECDEEPPHNIDYMSKRAALVVAAALGSDVYDEIYPMRKTVIDGSNTSGFQRTMLVARGGNLDVDGVMVGVQSICLEEDSARVIGEEDGMKVYALDRLGIPLVEIALEPMAGDTKAVRRAAEALGRLLRSTKMTARGIGTIRQDVNVSVSGGGGVVEVKGVQYLDQLERVIQYEAERQMALVDICRMIQAKNLNTDMSDVFDVTDMVRGCDSAILQDALCSGNVVSSICLYGYGGMLGMEPRHGMRLGRELGQVVRYFGVGGVFHSDELPGYGITQHVLDMVYERAQADHVKDAMVLVAAPPDHMGMVVKAIMRRIQQAGIGVPAETRLAEQSGQTRFMRPRPGSARMYPETDIPPVLVSEQDIIQARSMVPRPWKETIQEFSSRYGVNAQLSEQLLDSDYVDVFDDIVSGGAVSPAFVASVLCYDMKSLAREGLDVGIITNTILCETFALLYDGSISKEGVVMILRDIAVGHSDTVSDAVKNTGVGRMSDDHINKILDDIVSESHTMIEKMGERAAGPLMGVAMSRLRGRAPGDVVSRLLLQKIRGG